MCLGCYLHLYQCLAISSVMLTQDSRLCSSSAVRFGRIPKREKQRLLDEMQSYMNSLNESATIDEMEVSPPADGLCSPQAQAPEAQGSVSQSYCAALLSADEKPLKMAAGSSGAGGSLGAPSYQDSASHPAAQAQHAAPGEQANLPSGYHIPAGCPAKAENHAHANGDNAKYSFSSSPAQCPFSGSLSSQSYQASQTSHPTRDSQSQSPCPWKLNGGAKVLVRSYDEDDDGYYYEFFFKDLNLYLTVRKRIWSTRSE